MTADYVVRRPPVPSRRLEYRAGQSGCRSWLDVLVAVEDVVGVVGRLDLGQPLVLGRPVGRPDPVLLVLGHVVDVAAAVARERSEPIPPPRVSPPIPVWLTKPPTVARPWADVADREPGVRPP